MDASALADREAIRAVLHGYALAVDRKDRDAVARCFTPDCAYDGALARGTIADALEALVAAFARYERTMHVVGTQAIDLDGDRARAETYCVAYHIHADGAERTVGVRYVDALVRTTDEWRICERTVRVVWERTSGATS